MIRRVTNPTLKKLYRFVLKKLVGRFLEDDITLDQLDVHLRAGRLELTDLSLKVEEFSPILKDQPFRISSARVGKLRVEISYTNILSESLTFNVDDIVVDVVPRISDNGEQCEPYPEELSPSQGVNARSAGRGVDIWDGDTPLKDTARTTPIEDRCENEPSEGLDFVAQWIEQITSKIKAIVNNITIRVSCGENKCGKEGLGSSFPGAVIHVASLGYFDETPDHLPMATAVSQQGASAVSNGGYDPSLPRDARRMGLVAHKRLSVGEVSIFYQEEDKHKELFQTTGGSTVLVKLDRSQRQGGDSEEPMLDVDISVSHVHVALGASDCTVLARLAAGFTSSRVEAPSGNALHDGGMLGDLIQPSLFQEHFWYCDDGQGMESDQDTTRELNFATLESLLHQYAEARARLLQEMDGVRPVSDASGGPSLEDSDCFFDCIDTIPNPEGDSGGAKDVKFHVQVGGARVVLLIEEQAMRGSIGMENVSTTNGASSGARLVAATYFQLLMNEMSYTMYLDPAQALNHQDAGIDSLTFCHVEGVPHDWDAGWVDEGLGRSLLQFPEQPSSSAPCLWFKSVASGSDPSVGVLCDNLPNVSVDVSCLPMSITLDIQTILLFLDFVGCVQNSQCADEAEVLGHSGDETLTQQSHVSMTVSLSIPVIRLCLPVNTMPCTSAAASSLYSSIHNSTSPVAWELEDATRGLSRGAPALLLHLEMTVLTLRTGQPTLPMTSLESRKARCHMILPWDGESIDGLGSDQQCVSLFFLEATSSFKNPAPLLLEFGPSDKVGNGKRIGIKTPPSAKLEFLHTWEPNEGGDNGLGGMGPSDGGSEERLRGDLAEDSEGGEKPSSSMLWIVLPSLAVELSRLEYVVLVDLISAIMTPPNCTIRDKPGSVYPVGDTHDTDPDPSQPLEVLVEADGATLVLHEAKAFAESPGPYSFVLNLCGARVHLTGGGNGVGEDNGVVNGVVNGPSVTLSSRDLSLHEALLCENGSYTERKGPIMTPIMFSGGEETMLRYHTRMDLTEIGYIPVLYQTKWVKGESGLAAELTLASTTRGACKILTATLNLYHVSLRHTVSSTWLVRLLGLVVGDVPSGMGAPACSDDGNLDNTGQSSRGQHDSLTKMFITVFNGVVDYMPSNSLETMHQMLPGIDCSREITTGRTVVPIGVLRVSSNMVPGAPMQQGFKLVIRDMALYMSNNPSNYNLENSGLCGGFLGLQGGESGWCDNSQATFGPMPSVQDYLEGSEFVQIATLNFLDAFLRTKSQVETPSDSFLALELWMGVIHMYTCQDSLNTTQ
ncbi:unnamed protein product, partial [Choristocarpus tenellus]